MKPLYDDYGQIKAASTLTLIRFLQVTQLSISPVSKSSLLLRST